MYAGGGECSLDNVRTLCVPCHAAVTAAQARGVDSESALPVAHLFAFKCQGGLPTDQRRTMTESDGRQQIRALYALPVSAKINPSCTLMESV